MLKTSVNLKLVVYKNSLRFSSKVLKNLHSEFKIIRNMVFFDEFNALSNIASLFLMVLTFFKTPTNRIFDNLISDLFVIFSEFLGSYTYRAIGYSLRLTSILKKTRYIRRYYQYNSFKSCKDLRIAVKPRIWYFTVNKVRIITRFFNLKFYEKKLKNTF